MHYQTKREHNRNDNYGKNQFIDLILKNCISFTKKKEFKEELNNLIAPFISLLLKEIYPYIFFTLLFAFTSFIILLVILYILVKTHKQEILLGK